MYPFLKYRLNVNGYGLGRIFRPHSPYSSMVMHLCTVQVHLILIMFAARAAAWGVKTELK